MIFDKGNAQDKNDATVLRSAKTEGRNRAQGKFHITCFDKAGNLKWQDTIDNVVTDVGANFLLNTGFGGSQNTTYFLGLISSVGYSTPPAVGNTMASHTGWNEAGNGVNYPNWSTPASNARATVTWAAASGRAKALSAAAQFIIATNGGTIKGSFIVTGSGSVATNADTNGTLYGVGLFSGGDKVLQVGDTLNVSYSTSI